jgi:hypothetical protein
MSAIHDHQPDRDLPVAPLERVGPALRAGIAICALLASVLLVMS